MGGLLAGCSSEMSEAFFRTEVLRYDDSLFSLNAITPHFVCPKKGKHVFQICYEVAQYPYIYYASGRDVSLPLT